MQRIHYRAVTVMLLALLIATSAVAQTRTQAKCQSAIDRIERYTALRRKGGSASQMQQWKEQLRASEDQFRRLQCKYSRSKLR